MPEYLPEIIQAGAVVAAGIWAVAKIRSTTLVLQTAIDHLDDRMSTALTHLDRTIMLLNNTIDKLGNTIQEHEKRLIRLEVMNDKDRAE